MTLEPPFLDLDISVTETPPKLPGLLGSTQGLLLCACGWSSKLELVFLWTSRLGWRRFSDGAGAPLPARDDQLRSVAAHVCEMLALFEILGLTEDALTDWLSVAVGDPLPLSVALEVMGL